MQKDFYLTRYALIIKKIESNPLSYPQLEDYLLNSFEFQDAGVTSYSIRTLQRDIKEISRLFNISIHNKKKGDNRYYIERKDELENDDYNQKLLESFQISNTLNLHPDFSDFIFFESRKPSGLHLFYDLFFAIRNKRIIKFEHYNYKTKEKTVRKVHPLALKESGNRWYLISIDTKDKMLKSFGLDRISFLEVTKSKFRENYKCNLKEHFKHSFGVMNISGQNPEKIVLRCGKEQGEYIKSFPLHQSQRYLRETQENIYLEFFLHPTYDFMQELLSYGEEVTIEEPASFANQIKSKLKKAYENYERT
ncbi:helix-turn-helix transcriptional regulator [Chryseobacterium koreense]|uniref:Uncharacterized protein n=1 Tax=Chryseobacterium koreense CCUG 49689 TaxID=1304281 RepID=A0A0J7J2T8_9FLAO|nr:WYL domain-containing protein [Chryseobacterium koreense]KMQ72346.1 hypothetical protein ACM44_02585 [Chryseobacterium koreense CCUG 49689]MBB5333957.1 putative DNA-binding transcriptional regulator YafY [Chryseobacterium koreense]